MSHIASTQYFSIKLQRSKIQHRNRMAYRIFYWNTKQLGIDLYGAYTYDTWLTMAINFKRCEGNVLKSLHKTWHFMYKHITCMIIRLFVVLYVSLWVIYLDIKCDVLLGDFKTFPPNLLTNNVHTQWDLPHNPKSLFDVRYVLYESISSCVCFGYDIFLDLWYGVLVPCKRCFWLPFKICPWLG